MARSHIMTLLCDDRPGIVHAVTAALLDVDGNIIENSQFTDPDTNLFCMRTVVDTDVDDPDRIEAAVRARLGDVDARVRVRLRDHRPNVLVMVSKADHCLVDLLYRQRNGLLPIEIPLIVSNHPDCAEVAARYDVPFRHLPVTAEENGPTSKAEQEARVLDLVESHEVELVVLARYMQILSPEFCAELTGRIINIHHSFLPGFKGARPYHRAHERGVKIIGATAHFATPDLDEGPIIEQDVTHVSHADTVDDLIERGQDTERLVLSRAVRAWAEDRILLLGDKTVVFR